MASMKFTPAEAKEERTELASPSNPQWMVSPIYLNDKALEALKLKGPLKGGTKVTITATAYVDRAATSSDSKGESEDSMSLQITELELEPQGKRDLKGMFPKSKMED